VIYSPALYLSRVYTHTHKHTHNEAAIRPPAATAKSILEPAPRTAFRAKRKRRFATAVVHSF